MAEGKPRLARLTAIVIQLQSKQVITAREIAEKHGISIRTVYRDMRTLEASGIPLTVEEGKGYSMMQGYRLPPIMLTEAEANALITAEHLIALNKEASLIDQYKSAVLKIKAVLRGSQKEKLEFLSNRLQVRGISTAEKTSSYLIQLQSAIANFQVVRIAYRSLDNNKSERAIEPFALYTTQNNWILIAFCREREAFRAFRLDRIQQLTRTNHLFTPHEGTLEDYLEKCRKEWLHP